MARGKTYTKQDNGPLEPIDGPMFRQSLQRQGTGKARRADTCGPLELALLPDAWLDALGYMMGRWQDDGSWPDALELVVFLDETEDEG